MIAGGSRFFICFLSLVFLTGNSFAQDIKFSDPVLLPNTINTEYEEASPLVPPDGKSLYFVRAFCPSNKGGKGSGTDIWVSQLDNNGSWTLPTNNLRWNNKLNNVIIGVKNDSKVVYLLNSYNNKKGIAFSKHLNGDWTSPELITVPGVENLNFVGFYMNPSFTILLMSMVKEDSFGKEDLYVSLKDSLGRWSNPINLGSTINTDGFEIAPFLSADEKKLYFTSDGHKGLGNADIFVAERLHDSWTTWSRPKNLGDKINSPKFDAYFSIHDSTCFFTSNRASTFSDIYQARVEKVKRMDLRDSVNRIIEQTKKLLSELEKIPAGVEPILFRDNTFTLDATQKNQLKKWIGNFDLKLLQSIEIISSQNPMAFEQTNEISDNLIKLGIDKTKIVKVSNSKATPKVKGAVELKIYLKKN
jgi:WD40-like Beta Propeller Repeat